MLLKTLCALLTLCVGALLKFVGMGYLSGYYGYDSCSLFCFEGFWPYVEVDRTGSGLE